MRREELRPAFDLYALGRSVQEILRAVRAAEGGDPKLLTRDGRESIFSKYQWLYLNIIARRLLDGEVENPSSDVIPSLTEGVMTEIRYQSADDALEDVEKLLSLYDLEGEVPELNPDIASYIQIPHCKVPLTPRVRAILDHPTFRRLGQITQLGFVSLVYPGATHTRLEHVLGTFSACSDYLRALWYDDINPLFRSVMRRSDLELGLLAALVHDIAQYPMAHDLGEVSSRFDHELFTQEILERQPQDAEESLGTLIGSSEWNVDIDTLLSVMNAKQSSPFRHQVLHSIISGPLDCDKVDYLRRDSIHIGAPFAASIDEGRLIRNLTLVYAAESVGVRDAGFTVSSPKLLFAEIGVVEKALVIARSLWRTRQDMFTQVYWHHSVRALKAMLGCAVRRVLVGLNDEASLAAFWLSFQRFMSEPTRYQGDASSGGSESGRARVEGELLFDGPVRSVGWTSSGLVATDECLIRLLWQFANPAVRMLLSEIGSRRIYRRVAVLSKGRDPERFMQIYARFVGYRANDDVAGVERLRVGWEDAVRGQLLRKLRANPVLVPHGMTLESLEDALQKRDPFILVDVPVKSATARFKREEFYYLPEDYSGPRGRDQVFPQFRPEYVSLGSEQFDHDVGKIRVFVASEWAKIVAHSLSDDEIISALIR